MKRVPTVVALTILSMVVPIVAFGAGESEQLEMVRRRIGALERRLTEVDSESRDVQVQRERLTTELELAEVRVREVELLLARSRQEALLVAAAAAELASEVEQHRRLLEGHVEVMALLGRPGTMQLLYDGARGGDLESAISTVTVLTSGQLQLVEEYGDLHRKRSARLAELSRILEQARSEATQLEDRQAELETTRRRVDARIGQLALNQRNTESELDELRQREQALGRLLETIGERKRFAGNDDIRTFRGALPWPVSGTVVQGFGKHYLPKYSTYTVCNGLRFAAGSGAEVKSVFPGEVAFARFFKGYGNMVVIDHGRDVYSLVAGLATIHVRVDQRVEMGVRLGLASPPSDGGNTYFEIRVGKKPQDPRRWLQLKPAMSDSGG